VRRSLERGQPVISVDTKKKELIGRYYNKDQRWLPKGQPEEVKVHDFIDPEEPKAIPYGIYDVAQNLGWVNVAVTTTRPALRWRASGARGPPWDARLTRKPIKS